MAREIAKPTARLYFSRGAKASTVEGEIGTCTTFHRQEGTELPIKHSVIKSVKADIARENVLKEESQRFRSPISWVMLKQGL